MSQTDICIRLERPAEQFAVEELVRNAFWNVYRPGCMEHFVLHCLRGDPAFVPGKTIGVRYADDPNADYFLVKELRPGYLHGVSGSYRDPEGYFVCLSHPEAFAAYETQFPVKH